MILMRKTSLESLDFKKFLRRLPPDLHRATFGGTLLFRRAVKNRIIEILFYYILIKAHFVIFPCLK